MNDITFLPFKLQPADIKQLANTITSIGSGAFSGCPNLTNISVENGNTVYDSRDNCNAIIKTATNTLVVGCKNTVIPNSITSIGRYAFDGCTELTSIEIPNSVTSIGIYAFAGCTNLSRIVITNSVLSITENMFSGFTALKDLFILSSNPLAISEDAFEYWYGAYSSITLHIPYGSASAYKSAAIWSKFANYVEFNQPNNPTHQPVTLYMPDITGVISRWEYSRDGGASWTNIECEEYCYTETDPERGEVLYRVLKTDGTYGNILTINYYDPVPETIATTPTSETKTVDECVTFALNVKDDGYTYQWMLNNVAIEGATNSTYSIPSIKMKDAGEYFCVVSNPVSCVNSTSSKLTVNKCPQIITFPEIETKTFGDEAFTLPATTDKGLTINYQSTNSNVATVDGNVVTIKEPGETNIIANQAGNDDYLEAAYVSRKLTVKKAEQKIEWHELPAKKYGDEPFELNVTTNNNRPVVLTSSDASVLSIKGTTATIRGAGNVTITALQEATDEYEKAETQISIVVGKAILTASVSNAERVYGDENPNFKITYSGFVNNETKEDLEMTPVATCRATRYSNVGEYDITISSFTDKNYVLDAKKAKLVIKKALITVSPYDVTKVYGEKNPALQITYSGFKNNENESILLSKAVAFTKVKTMSNAGEYAITTEGANAVNYEFEYKESIFTVSKAPLVITAEDKNINYMEEIPMFTILYDGFVGNDSEADLDELPRISCDATNEAKPGTYEIVLSGGYDNNYEYTLINGTMVIIDTTGINAIELDLENNLVYDLNGLRITETENLTRGIYIINGRKVFVK